jgi:uncharacterized protein YutE (UPF0331/DUF86 family)
MKQREERERRQLEQIAAEYREKGYQVLVEPNSMELPGNLRAFQPDLIATSEVDSVVVEVRSRASLSEDPRLAALADAVQSMRGWRFDLVVLNPRTAQDHRIGTSLNQSEISKSLDAIRHLVQQGFIEPAYMAAWATVEATLRDAASRFRVRLPAFTPAVVLKTLFSEGVLSKSSYEKLSAAMRLRSSVAHGFVPTEDPIPHLQNMLEVIEEVRTADPQTPSST